MSKSRADDFESFQRWLQSREDEVCIVDKSDEYEEVTTEGENAENNSEIRESDVAERSSACAKNVNMQDVNNGGHVSEKFQTNADKSDNLTVETGRENITKANCVRDNSGNESAGTLNMSKVVELMMEENRRRDDLFERLFTQIVTNQKLSGADTTNASAVPHSDTASYQIMPDLMKNIRTYDGESKTEGSMWIDNINSMRILHKWPNAFSLETARSNLRGGAQQWMCCQNDITTFEQFEIEFRKTFAAEVSPPEKWRRMTTRVQNKSETLNNYFHEKVKLCLDVGLDFENVKEQILVGLWDRNLCSIVMGKTQNNINELLRDLQTCERINEARVNRIRAEKTCGPSPPETRNRVRNENSKAKEYTSNSGRSARHSEVKEEAKLRCYNCGENSHMSKNCTKPRMVLCFTCGKQGHISPDCPEYNAKGNRTKHTNQARTRTFGGEAGSSQMLITPADTKNVENVLNCEKFLKEIYLNEKHKLVAMVDSGSAVSTVKSEIVEKFELKTESKRQELHGFGDIVNNTIVSQEYCEPSVKLDEVCVEKVELTVVPNNAQVVDIIIGRNFTELPELAYVRIGETLHFGYANNDPFKNIEIPGKPRKIALQSAAEKVLRANSINLIQVRCDENMLTIPVENNSSVDLKLISGQTVGYVTEKPNELSLTEPIASEIDGAKPWEKGEEFNKEPERTAGQQVKLRSEEEKPRAHITREQLVLGPRLTSKNVEDLLKLINEYRECFALSLAELGCTNLMEMKIVDNGIPVKCKPYRATAENRGKIAEIVNEWKRYGIATDTTSPYASPVILIAKKTGEPRLVVDYRKLNQQTKKEHFPLMNLDEQFENLAGNKIFTTLDLAHAFFQLPLDEESKEKTAFVTPDDTGQFERMCFGLSNSPSNFARLITKALGPLRNKVAMAYLDDVLVPAENWESMLVRLRQVFEALRSAHLTIKLKKCVFGADHVNYLGFKLSASGISPGENKVDAIEKFREPSSVREVKRFLGLTGFFRRFVKNYATIVRPISDLTRKEQVFAWGEHQKCAFDLLKETLTSEPVLKLYNPKARTELHTDASAVGLAGLLLQEGEDKKLHLVYAVSKKTTDVEATYHSSKLELMAIVWSIDRLRHLLLPIHFTVITDCQALVYLNMQKTTNAQIARWSYLLQEFDMEIKFRNGEKMAHVDALSRAPTEACDDTMEKIFENRLEVYSIMTEEERILAVQQSDQKLSEIIKVLRKPKTSRTRLETDLIRNYKLVGGRLLRQVCVNGETRDLYMIPNSMRKSTVIKFHDLSGHFGVDRTVNLILNNYYFPGVRSYVKQHIRGCCECLLVKIPTGKPTKTQRKYKGPFVVTEVLGKDTYRINSIVGTEGRLFTTTVHASLMKIYKNQEADGKNCENVKECEDKGELGQIPALHVQECEIGQLPTSNVTECSRRSKLAGETTDDAETDEDGRSGILNSPLEEHGSTGTQENFTKRVTRTPSYLKDFIQ